MQINLNILSFIVKLKNVIRTYITLYKYLLYIRLTFLFITFFNDTTICKNIGNK
jgi:hypothetical protein